MKGGSKVTCPVVVSKVYAYTFRIFLETAKAMEEVKRAKGGMVGRV